MGVFSRSKTSPKRTATSTSTHASPPSAPTSSTTTASVTSVDTIDVLTLALDTAVPALAAASKLAAASEPIAHATVDLARTFWTRLAPYHPHEFGPAIVGFMLCFFGGYFATLTAAVEAYRITGWERTRDALGVIARNVEAAQLANMKDDELDEDGNGIPDTQEITRRELVIRKVDVVAKAVNPEQMTEAFNALYMGFVAVVATLRVHFAACVSLGCAVGDITYNVVDQNLTPVIMMGTPKEYQKWVQPGTRYACTVVGVIAAWMLQQAITAWHSAARGAQLAARGTLKYLVRHKYVSPNVIDEKGSFFNAAVFALAACGFWSQVSYGFRLPFPLNIFFFPIRVLEFMLRVTIGTMAKTDV